MMLRTRKPRGGFTLTEILVVMGIIATMIALLVPAIMRAGDAGKRTQASAEMGEFSTAIGLFKNKYSVDYLPSRIKLCENWTQYGTTQLDVDSQVFLRNCWPNLNTSIALDWNGNGTADQPVILEGDQCLVFFLGGISDGGQPVGFSTNPANPTVKTGNQRVGPFIQFQAERLLPRTTNFDGSPNDAGVAGYRSYLDPWKKQFYAYFSNYGKINNYGKYGTSDCATLGANPYISGAGKYFNENGFQIICAGKDKTFWKDLTQPYNSLPAPGVGEDDQANFSQTPLGNK